jgi:hypothetical protein
MSKGKGPIDGRWLIGTVVKGGARKGEPLKPNAPVVSLYSDDITNESLDGILKEMADMGFQPESLDVLGKYTRRSMEVAKSRQRQALELIEQHDESDAIVWKSLAGGEPIVLFKSRRAAGSGLTPSDAEVIAGLALAAAREEVQAELAALRAAYADVQKAEPLATTGDPLTDRLLGIIERQADPTINVNMNETWTPEEPEPSPPAEAD